MIFDVILAIILETILCHFGTPGHLASRLAGAGRPAGLPVGISFWIDFGSVYVDIFEVSTSCPPRRLRHSSFRHWKALVLFFHVGKPPRMAPRGCKRSVKLESRLWSWLINDHQECDPEWKIQSDVESASDHFKRQLYFSLSKIFF